MALHSSSSASLKSYERTFYEYERSPYSFVSPSALLYQATDRLKLLARAKIRKETTIREGFSRYISDPTYSGVGRAAIHAQCTPRLMTLASPKLHHQLHKFELPVPRPISRSALRYQPSERIQELSLPKKRHSAC